MRTDQALMLVRVPDPGPEMITVWRTTAPNTTITLPFTATGTYDCEVDWGDGSTTSGVTWNGAWASHIYVDAGDYVVTITGTATHWSFNDGGSKARLIEVTSLGDLGWTNFAGAFYGCNHLIVVAGGVVDAVTDMSYMFTDAVSATPFTANWNTGNVTNMLRMFRDAASANPDVTNWNVSKVTNMIGMFQRAYLASPNVSNWDVSSVLTFDAMFYAASVATPNTSSWDTSSATSMSYMFTDAQLANPDVTNWDVSHVTNMGYMFSGTEVATPNVSNWVTTSLLTTGYMFAQSELANPDVSNWDMSHVTSIAWMFYFADSANPDTSTWVVTALTNAQGAFFHATGMTNSVRAAIFWNNLSILTFNDCFTNAVNVSNYIDIPEPWGGPPAGDLFQVLIETTAPDQTFKLYTANANHLYINWGDGSAVDDVVGSSTRSHVYASAATHTISMYGTTERISFGNFTGATPTLVKEVLSAVSPGVTGIISTASMFYGCINLTTIFATFLDAISGNITGMADMFNGAVAANPNTSNWDTSEVLSFARMFKNAILANPDVGDWVTTNVSDTSSMFYNADSANPDVSIWDVSNVVDMSYMFYGTAIATPDTSNWVTSSVVNLANMFASAILANPDVSGWDVSHVNNMSYMFYDADAATPDTSLWNTSSVTNMNRMFAYTALANPNVSDWDVSHVTDMELMFSGTTSANPDISNWNMNTGVRLTQTFASAIGMVRTINAAQFWERQPFVPGWFVDCFNGAINLLNRDEIPFEWGGNKVGWNVEIQTSSPSQSFGVYLNTPSALHVDWGDGTHNDYTGGASTKTHVYADVGTYTVVFSGPVVQIAFGNYAGTTPTLVTAVLNNVSGVLDWLTNCSYMFYGCSNLATIAPTFIDYKSGDVVNMAYMFYGCTLANPNTSNWDTSLVTNMSNMFNGAIGLLGPMTAAKFWDNAGVLTYTNCFLGAVNVTNYADIPAGWKS